jgi:hypothetical protein
MHIKSLALYSFPYLVGAASLVVAAHEVAPTALRFQDTNTKSAIISSQVVNRSLKSDRLPIMQAGPQANDKGNIRVPARIAPSPEVNIRCEGPMDLDGRCFA